MSFRILGLPEYSVCPSCRGRTRRLVVLAVLVGRIRAFAPLPRLPSVPVLRDFGFRGFRALAVSQGYSFSFPRANRA